MGSRNQFPHRCEDCGLRKALCLCALVERIRLDTKVIILIHHRETRRPSNTGKLAALILENSELRVRGLKGSPMEAKGLVVPERQSLLLFPTEDSVDLTDGFLGQFTKPLTLIVPDGNWRQASRMPSREPAISAIPRVKIPLGKPTEYRLRSENRPGGLATFEAIARAMGVIEGAEVQAKMEGLFKLKVERQLWSRSKISLDECTTGIPPEAIC